MTAVLAPVTKPTIISVRTRPVASTPRPLPLRPLPERRRPAPLEDLRPPARPVSEEAPIGLLLGVAAVLMVLFGAFTIIAGRGGFSGVAPQREAVAVSAETPSVVAKPGDSLWTIARSIEPTGDLRPVVDELISLNGSAAIQAGQTIYLPG